MDSTDIRWMQRFQNFDRAFVLLRSAMEDKEQNKLSQLELEGLIQRFEFCYELAWKTMKDYLEYNGVVLQPVTARNVIKEAFAAKIISDGQVWIDIMLHRNLLSHTYDSLEFNKVLDAISARYLDAFDQLHDWFIEKGLEN